MLVTIDEITLTFPIKLQVYLVTWLIPLRVFFLGFRLGFLCILLGAPRFSCVPRGALRFLIYTTLLIKKKKKSITGVFDIAIS
jgi:hypothetical protein